MPTISGEDWISRNSDRSYPILEDSSPELLSGDPLPNNILADALLVVAMAPGQVSVTSVAIRSGSVSVEFSCGGRSIGSAKAILGSTREGDQVPIESSRGLSSGWVVFGSILAMDSGTLSSMSGLHPLFDTFLESRCLVFSGEAAIKSVSSWSGDEMPVSGDVQVVVSESLSLTSELQEDGSFIVSVRLVTPPEFLPDCIPQTTDEECGCPDAIRYINGVTGDEDGNLSIVVISPPGAPSGSIWTHPTQNSISILVATPKKFFCVESPVVPDIFGRLGPNFDADCPPARNYGIGFSGPDCTNPPPVIPDPHQPDP